MHEFRNPAAFFLMLLIPLLFILRRAGIFRRISFPAVLSDWGAPPYRWNGRTTRILPFLAAFFFCSGFIVSVAALAEPVIPHQEKVYTSAGTDIMFALDTSPSMAAIDMSGTTRLEAAENTIKSLVSEYDGWRFGLVVFGSEAAVAVPPTSDRSLFISRVMSVVPGGMGEGSAVGTGLGTAVYHLVSSSARKKCIVLITDGENNSGEIHPETSAGIAAANGIPVYVVGIGTKGTVKIDYKDPVTGKLYSGYLESGFDSAPLKKIAAAGNGRYFEAHSTDELAGVLDTVAGREKSVQTFSFRTADHNLYFEFICLAAVLFALAWIVRRIFLNEVI